MTLQSIKNSFFILVAAAGIAACNGKTSDSRDIQLLTDSSAYNNSLSTDSARVNQASSELHPQRNAAGDKSTSASESNASADNSTSSASQADASTANTGSSSATATEGTEKKKGWSKAAQGAVIGGATGAVGGAIISKKKGTGAAIGAAVGAAGGYIIGREKDKKDGRVKK